MKIIPVIDLKDGLVVHARQGDRDRYRPIRSALCGSAEIEHVLEAFLQVYPFDTFYLADLNAIGNDGNQDQVIDKLARDYPDNTFWIDRGFRSADLTYSLPKHRVPVVGSESMGAQEVESLTKHRERAILSLDFAGSGPIGHQSLFDTPNIWPDTVIIMTLAQVGSVSGPNLTLLNHYCQNYPNTRFVAAGGVRNSKDLLDLQQIGIQRVLVASALHARTIGRQEIIAFNSCCRDQYQT